MSIKDFKAGSTVTPGKMSVEAHHTTPPALYSEVSLIAKLTDSGIGRPSTFASIVSLIQERGYVIKKGNSLIPTALGFAVIRLLMKKFPQYISYDYTSEMEAKLDEVAEGKISRDKFLGDFWSGKTGFYETLEKMKDKIDFEEIKELSTIDLHNGYSIIFNKFGTFLQDEKAPKDEKGYKPSVKIDDKANIEEFLNEDTCKDLLKNASTIKENELSGVLEEGPYKGWIATLKNGKFGPYIQAVNPNNDKDKPVNNKLPEDLTIETITFEDIKKLFEEVKLPRVLNENFFVGIGKRGPWMAYKASAKSRKAVFKKLPEEFDPRTVSLEDVKKAWEDKETKK